VSGTADGSFATPTVVSQSSEFVCVRATQKVANHYKVKSVPAVVFTDSDGDEICRATFLDESSLQRAMKTALEKYRNQPVRWKSEAGATSKKLLVVGFDDEAGEALKVLEDRSIVKFHDRCEFVRLPARKDGEEAKKWGVASFPAVVLCDPSQENPEKSPIEKIVGKKSTAAVKLAIQRALAKVEKQ
jgi:hypothetical protein